MRLQARHAVCVHGRGLVARVFEGCHPPHGVSPPIALPWPPSHGSLLVPGATGLIGDLRRLKLKQALELRSEMAQRAAAASSQRRTVDRMVLGLAKQGI